LQVQKLQLQEKICSNNDSSGVSMLDDGEIPLLRLRHSEIPLMKTSEESPEGRSTRTTTTTTTRTWEKVLESHRQAMILLSLRVQAKASSKVRAKMHAMCGHLASGGDLMLEDGSEHDYDHDDDDEGEDQTVDKEVQNEEVEEVVEAEEEEEEEEEEEQEEGGGEEKEEEEEAEE
jgi:hypothetical protein